MNPPDPINETVGNEEDEPAEQVARGAPIGRYIVLEQLGAGGMGVVYVAYDPELHRRVAVKLVRQKTPEGNSMGRSRLLREAQAIARLAHPNVIAIHDVGTFRDHVFIAMELVEGATVADWLRERERSVAEVLHVFAQAARGLQAAHQAGLVHRDFKPENVLVGNDGRVRVVDFGLVQSLSGNDAAAPTTSPATDAALLLEASAKLPKIDVAETLAASHPAAHADRLSTPLTQAGTFLGTPMYMAPEQFLNQPTNAASDQFSFCVALYEALYKQRPFGGENFYTIGVEVTGEQVRTPSSRRRVPAHLWLLIRRGLKRNPSDRFASMQDLLVELERDPTRARRRALWAVGGIALIGIALGGEWAALHRRSVHCGEAGAQIASVWGPAQRSQMEHRFRDIGTAFASDGFAMGAGVLDGYADTWRVARTEACEATQSRGEQSQERVEQRIACLDERREELRSLVDLFVHADKGVAMKAAHAAQSLDPIEDCSLQAISREGPHAPIGADARAAVANLRRDLGAATALFLTGKFAESLHAVEPLTVQAAALKYRPVEAETLLLQGRIQAAGSEPATALPTLERAVAVADAGQADSARASAMTVLATDCDALGQNEMGMRWAHLAQAAVERIGTPPVASAAVEIALGDLTESQASWDESIAHYRRALELIGASSKKQSAEGAVHNNLALAFEGQGKLKEALAEAERAHTLLEKDLGPNHPTVALSLNNVGYYQMSLGNTVDARRNIETALKVAEAAVGTEHPKLALELNNLCAIARDEKRFDDAEAACQRALAIRRKAFGEKHVEVAAALSILGSVADARGDHARAMQLDQQALTIREQALGPRHPSVLSDLLGLAEVEVEAGRDSEAALHLERVIPALVAPEQKPELLWAQFLLARAHGHDGKKEAETARAALVTMGADRKVKDLDTWLALHRPTGRRR